MRQVSQSFFLLVVHVHKEKSFCLLFRTRTTFEGSSVILWKQVFQAFSRRLPSCCRAYPQDIAFVVMHILKIERHVTGLCILTEHVACCLARDSTTFHPSIFDRVPNRGCSFFRRHADKFRAWPVPGRTARPSIHRMS
jgi:hypothetical protein